jgi:hypothetical protein
LEQFCDIYRRNARCAQQATAQRPRAVRLVRYETFTADPEQELRDICAFLDEPFEAAMLDDLDIERSRWAHSEGSRVLYGPIIQSTKDWRDYLSLEQARRIEDKLITEMTRFGYQRYVPEQAQPTGHLDPL